MDFIHLYHPEFEMSFHLKYEVLQLLLLNHYLCFFFFLIIIFLSPFSFTRSMVKLCSQTTTTQPWDPPPLFQLRKTNEKSPPYAGKRKTSSKVSGRKLRRISTHRCCCNTKHCWSQGAQMDSLHSLLSPSVCNCIREVRKENTFIYTSIVFADLLIKSTRQEAASITNMIHY